MGGVGGITARESGAKRVYRTYFLLFKWRGFLAIINCLLMEMGKRNGEGLQCGGGGIASVRCTVGSPSYLGLGKSLGREGNCGLTASVYGLKRDMGMDR